MFRVVPPSNAFVAAARRFACDLWQSFRLTVSTLYLRLLIISPNFELSIYSVQKFANFFKEFFDEIKEV